MEAVERGSRTIRTGVGPCLRERTRDGPANPERGDAERSGAGRWHPGSALSLDCLRGPNQRSVPLDDGTAAREHEKGTKEMSLGCPQCGTLETNRHAPDCTWERDHPATGQIVTYEYAG